MVSAVGSAFALIEVIYIVLQIAKANPANGAYQFVQRMADPLALFFPGLFTFSEPDLTVMANYGAAAVFWVIVSGLIARALA
ncbi:hypothetical protein EBN03_23055 [Nocardia stercoris]|uniref:YggT family protein n=1 Tax=Nocardia stercoris TaxID=2483361 RepID=A0A3M2KZW9_9NOCA|nr:hypothetical protein EBN03_23055 [Nocardia stercoris]